jgi:hypothetical protein
MFCDGFVGSGSPAVEHDPRTLFLDSADGAWSGSLASARLECPLCGSAVRVYFRRGDGPAPLPAMRCVECRAPMRNRGLCLPEVPGLSFAVGSSRAGSLSAFAA